jgi:hypothetical protein
LSRFNAAAICNPREIGCDGLWPSSGRREIKMEGDAAGRCWNRMFQLRGSFRNWLVTWQI